MTSRGDPDELGAAAGSDGLGRVITTTPDVLLQRGKRVLADCSQSARHDMSAAGKS
jgi:hypothetical protein